MAAGTVKSDRGGQGAILETGSDRRGVAGQWDLETVNCCYALHKEGTALSFSAGFVEGSGGWSVLVIF